MHYQCFTIECDTFVTDHILLPNADSPHPAQWHRVTTPQASLDWEACAPNLQPHAELAFVGPTLTDRRRLAGTRGK